MTEALAGVKPGDVLCTESRYGRRLLTVTKITPSGRVKCGNVEFKPDGRLRGGDVWTITRARVATPEDIAAVKREELVQRLRNQIESQWKLFTLEQLEALTLLSDTVRDRLK